MKNEIIKLAQEKCKEYLKEKSITYHPSYMWLCQYIAKQIYEQIMKDAVETEVWNYSSDEDLRAIPLFGIDKFNNLKDGDKVRIVVLKEEEE